VSDKEEPSRLSVALAKAAVQEIETLLLGLTGQLPAGDKDRMAAIIARYIEMVR
jgi:hypothetical protein